MSRYEQEVFIDRGLPLVLQSGSSQSSSEAAVGASCPAGCRQLQVVTIVCSHQIPYTPQYVVDWLYESLLDTVRVLETIMGAVSYDDTGFPQGDCAGQVMSLRGHPSGKPS